MLDKFNMANESSIDVILLYALLAWNPPKVPKVVP